MQSILRRGTWNQTHVVVLAPNQLAKMARLDPTQASAQGLVRVYPNNFFQDKNKGWRSKNWLKKRNDFFSRPELVFALVCAQAPRRWWVLACVKEGPWEWLCSLPSSQIRLIGSIRYVLFRLSTCVSTFNEKVYARSVGSRVFAKFL